ncbi:hypothetical protein DBZ36_03575 [Alginatibacterium sediminis]|uniref:Uncharacterized protein n=1 Tax=Alginatibacterium sediminis TaxID=2164068 RepID=A0A420EFU5_9ALTE|nr:hypothetical protein DBZ36_03575 [Alginatibacterium sediminis]
MFSHRCLIIGRFWLLKNRQKLQELGLFVVCDVALDLTCPRSKEQGIRYKEQGQETGSKVQGTGNMEQGTGSKVLE